MTLKILDNPTDVQGPDVLAASDWDGLATAVNLGQGYKYLIVKSGSTYYAKSSAGEIASSNSNFSTLLNAMIASCSDGDAIAIAPGTYTRTAQIDIQKNNFTLYGIGRVTLASSGHVCGIVCGDDSTTFEGIRIENIRIDMGNYGPVANDLQGVWLRKVNNFVVTHCDIGNCENGHAVRSAAIMVADCIRGEVSFNSVDNFSNGIVVGKTTLGTTTEGIRVIGNKVRDIDPYDCITVYRSAGKCIVQGNHCYDGFYSGVLIEGGVGFRSDNTVVSGNLCHDTQYGIFVYGGQNVTITGNVCYNNTNYGINVRSSDVDSEIALVGNTVNDATNAGIHIGDTSQHGTISGNNIKSCDIGIHIELSSHRWNITGNHIHKNNKYGIHLAGTNEHNITGNMISENSQLTHNTYSDIYLSGGAINNLVQDNRFNISSATTNKSKYAIEEAASTETGNIYRNNFFSTLHATGKILISSTTSKVIGNENYSIVTSKTNTDSPYTATLADQTININATSGSFILNLPTASGIADFTYTVNRTDILSSTNTVTIDASSTQTIDGNLTHLLYPGETVVLKSDGSNWITPARSQPTYKGYFRKGSSANRRIVAGALGSSTSLSASTTSPAANTLWAMPLMIEKTTKFDLISFRCTTLGSGNARAGIYRDDGNMYPGALIFDTGSIDTTTGTIAATRDTTITSSLQILQPGLYWLAWETDSATGQYTTHNSAASVVGFAGNDTGMGTTSAGYGYSVAHTFGALPDPYTAGGTLLTTAPAIGAPVVAVGLRPV